MKQPFNNAIYHRATGKTKRPYIAVKSFENVSRWLLRIGR
jgi:hypothetical protein